MYSIFSSGYNSLVVIGRRGVLLTDPAFTSRAEVLKEEIAKLTDKPVRRIVLSHEHYDHVGGTDVFPNAKIICHINCAPIFKLDTAGIAPNRVDREFSRFKRLYVSGKVVDLHYLAPADGVATTIVHMPREQIVFTADLYNDRSLTDSGFIDDLNYLGSRKILNRLSRLNLQHAVNAHNPDTSVSILTEYTQFVNDLYDEVNREITAAIESGGLGAAFGALFSGAIANSVQLSQYSNWTNYDQINDPDSRIRIL